MVYYYWFIISLNDNFKHASQFYWHTFLITAIYTNKQWQNNCWSSLGLGGCIFSSWISLFFSSSFSPFFKSFFFANHHAFSYLKFRSHNNKGCWASMFIYYSIFISITNIYCKQLGFTTRWVIQCFQFQAAIYAHECQFSWKVHQCVHPMRLCSCCKGSDIFPTQQSSLTIHTCKNVKDF